LNSIGSDLELERRAYRLARDERGMPVHDRLPPPLPIVGHVLTDADTYRPLLTIRQVAERLAVSTRQVHA
jgi:hypothetical protein